MKVTSKHQQNLATRVSRQSISGIALAASVLAGGGASAQSPQARPPQEITVEQSSSPSGGRNLASSNAAGLMVAIDRDTGQTRALTAAEAQKLADGLKDLVSQSTDGLVQVRRADGTVSIDLQGRFQNVTLARRESNGTIVQACVDTPENAAAFFDIDSTLVGTSKRAVTRTVPGVLETK